MENPAIITLSKRWKHHTKSGGYDRLNTEINSLDISPSDRKNNLFSTPFGRRVFNKLIPTANLLNGYGFNDLSAEIRCFRTARKVTNGVIHALYGEDQLLFLLKYRSLLHCALIATFHLPPESPHMERVLRSDYYKQLNALDAAVVVSNSLVMEYEKWIGRGNVFYVPHGIDCDVFKPIISPDHYNQRGLNIITVGGHGRDWNTICKVVKACINKSNIIFTIVAPAKKAAVFSGFPNVRFFTGIEENKLIKLYQKSDAAFIPVTYATANNSVLEALACGKPVISTQTGGIPDYIDSASGWMLPPDHPKSAVELIEALLKSKNLLKEKAASAREKALEFDWPVIANKLNIVYQHAWQRYKSERV